jgi:hypothetical protein
MNNISIKKYFEADAIKRIKENYDYDYRDGQLVNRKTGMAVRGKVTAKRNGNYRYLLINFGFNGHVYSIYSHHAIWAWHNGCFPTMQIDHVNGNGFDNHIENLREVTQSENQRNQHRQWKPNARTGLPGVWPKRKSYQIKVARHEYHFRDRFEAFYHLTLLGRRFK